MEAKVEVIDPHLLDVDESEDELVVHVLQQVLLQPGQHLLDHVLHHPVGEVGQPGQQRLVARGQLGEHLLLARGPGRLPGAGRGLTGYTEKNITSVSTINIIPRTIWSEFIISDV